MRRLVVALGRPRAAWIWAAASAGPLLFPSHVPYSALLVCLFVAVPCAAAWWTTQTIWPRTPLSIALGVLLAMTALAVAVSPVPDVSRPKFAGVVLGCLVTRALLLGMTRRSVLLWSVGAYLAAGCLVSSAGLLGAALNNKYLPSSITSRFPPRFQDVPGTDGFVNPNALGGTTLYFLPLAAILCLRGGRDPRGESRRRTELMVQGGLFVAAAVFVCILILSQSLTAWISAAVTTAAALIALRRRGMAAGIGLLLLAGAVYVWSSSGYLTARPEPPGPSQPSVDEPDRPASVANRLELWSQAVEAIRDAPVTGVGLNAFRKVAPVLYPTFPAHATEPVHAHNIFLQTALDVGIPGLVAYLALLMLCTVQCWHVYRRGDSADVALATGLWGGLLATHLFGLTDAIALGAKVGLFFWWNIGLIGVLHRLAISANGTRNRGACPP